MSKEELVEESQMKLKKVSPTAVLTLGSEKLIVPLQTHSIPFAVVTSSGSASLEMKVSRQEFFSLFSHIMLGDDPEVQHSKPDPNTLLVVPRGSLSSCGEVPCL
ncbi:Pseudouridine-5'-phosphatase [Plecturocebus cupreus]